MQFTAMRCYAPADPAAAAANSAPPELPAGCWEEERKGWKGRKARRGRKGTEVKWKRAGRGNGGIVCSGDCWSGERRGAAGVDADEI